MLTQILPYGVTRPQWVKKCHIDWLVFKGYTQHILRTVSNLQSYRRNLLASFPGYRQPPWVHTDPCLPPPHPPHLQQANMAAQSPLAHRTSVADRDQPEFLCSRSDSRYRSPCGHSGGWLTRYRPREVRNSIYRYRKIYIDYRSKFLYRFISPISIIYGNTTQNWFF